MRLYFYRIFIALSVLLNVILGGYSNQTFSARNYQWRREGRFNIEKPLDRILGEGHCLECWVNWILRRGHVSDGQ